MTNAPYLLRQRARRLPHGPRRDPRPHVPRRPEDAYDKGRLMGSFAEDCAESTVHARAAGRLRDRIGARAKPAIRDGAFAAEIAAGDRQGGKGETSVDERRAPLKARPAKIPTLKPAFRKDGTVTAANSSSISDGAAALVLTRARRAEQRGLEAARAHRRPRDPRARAQECSPTAPIGAINKLLRRRPAGRRAPSISSRSTRPSPWWRWRRCATSTCRTKRSTSTAAPARSATRSAPRARASS